MENILKIKMVLLCACVALMAQSVLAGPFGRVGNAGFFKSLRRLMPGGDLSVRGLNDLEKTRVLFKRRPLCNELRTEIRDTALGLGVSMMVGGGIGCGIMRDTSFSQLTVRGQKTREHCKTAAKYGGLLTYLGTCVMFPFGLCAYPLYKGYAYYRDNKKTKALQDIEIAD